MKTLIIAEKPSVCANIAHAVGASDKITSSGKKVSAYTNEKYIIAHAVGHLYNIGEPSDYGYSKKFRDSFQNNELPMFPEKFNLYPIKEKKAEDQAYKDELREFLQSLIDSEEVADIIEATDAAREGELIFREIYYNSGSAKPVKRLWVSSVTEEAILKGLADAKPMSEYDNIYKTAKLRGELDWMFGLNLSRLYTVLDNNNERVGRIMTPLLGIIVERDEKIDSFTSSKNYRIMLDGMQSEKVYETREEAQKAIDCSIGRNVSVKETKVTEKSENRPLLYSLNTLQMDGNAIYGMTAQQVLNAAQSLYEKKYTTYPRTDSEYLSEDMRNEVRGIVNRLSNVPEFTERAGKLMEQGLNIDSRVIDNSKISDHHAIIPNNIAKIDLSYLSEAEKNIYTLIVNRLLAVLDVPYKYLEYTFKLECNGNEYSGKFKKTVETGFKKHLLKGEDEEKEEEKPIPEYKENELFPCSESMIVVKEVVSQPPKHYTDKTLLSVMSNIDNRIESAELKSAVKGKGLGTSATRAAIIEKLIQCGYCIRKGKNIISLPFGRNFVKALPASILSVEMTAKWEQMFEDIVAGIDRSSELTENTKKIVTDIISYEKSRNDRQKVLDPQKAVFEKKEVGICPRCGKSVFEGKNGFYCETFKGREDKGCGFYFSKAHRNGFYIGEISTEQAKCLLRNEKIKLKTTDLTGKTYTAEWMLSDDIDYINIVKVKSEKEVIGICPRCGKNIYEGKLNFYCESGKDGCGFSLWKDDKHNKVNVTKTKAKELITGKIVSFTTTTANGSKDTIRLKMVDREINGKTYVNLDKVE